MSTIVQYSADEHTHALEPEMTRQERVLFTVYVVMGATILAFLTATMALWSLGV